MCVRHICVVEFQRRGQPHIGHSAATHTLVSFQYENYNKELDDRFFWVFFFVFQYLLVFLIIFGFFFLEQGLFFWCFSSVY